MTKSLLNTNILELNYLKYCIKTFLTILFYETFKNRNKEMKINKFILENFKQYKLKRKKVFSKPFSIYLINTIYINVKIIIILY